MSSGNRGLTVTVESDLRKKEKMGFIGTPQLEYSTELST